MVSEFPSFHRTVSSVSLLASKPIWDLSEKHCTSASSSGCPDLPRSSEERFWIHAVEASEAPLWGLQEFRPKMSVNIYKLKSLEGHKNKGWVKLHETKNKRVSVST